ncbi:hypothetical protein AURDEDRAFT_109873 [Auricularia subglabra TFB-10046 SS5]|nr:hypothetical protein AURDEDRAFT_109873 [Auricularia subglabra TFB-10046 SS5]
MFSSFRSTVEALAQGVERPKTPDQNGGQSRRSVDLFGTPSQLAESALSNLKKSLATTHNGQPSTPSSSVGRAAGRATSMSLEDRLRASFTVGEASRATTPGTPGRPGTPSQLKDEQPGTPEMDPLSVALPMSPVSRTASPVVELQARRDSQAGSPPPTQMASYISVRALVNTDDHPLSPVPPASPVPPTSPAPAADAKPEPEPAPEPSWSPPSPTKESPPAAPPEPELETEITEATPVAQEPAPEAVTEAPRDDAAGAVAPEDDKPPPSPTEEDITAEPEAAHAAAVAVAQTEPAEPIQTTPIVEEQPAESHPLPPVPPSEDPATSFVEDLPPPIAKDDNAEVDVEKLQARLKLVEQRFSDVSTSFKRLQAEKRAADGLLKELTPLESISDTEGLRDYLRNLSLKLEMSMEEIKRLNAQHKQQELRMEEIRDTHKLESASQVELIDQLRAQVQERDAKLAAVTRESQSQHSSLSEEVERAKKIAKEEEEKRTKAISLLKTVRTKLVKAEKDLEEKSREVAKEKDDRERAFADVKRIETDLERVRSEREREVRSLRETFDKEIANVRERFEREAAARKGQFELEAITTKATHNQELAAKNSQIATLENSVRSLSSDKNNLFDQLQLRQGELESAQSHLETLQSQTGELQYQLREANDRIALLTDELAVAGTQSPGSSMPSEDVARFLREAEGKAEARLSDLRERMRALERERNESEEEWARNLTERGREIERLRRLVGEKDGEYEESVRGMREREKKIGELEDVNAGLRRDMDDLRVEVAKVREQLEARGEVETSLKQEIAELQSRIDSMSEQADDLRSKESQLRATNKTLREELRKVQQSAALLERQRNPGVGYWSGKGQPNGSPGNGAESPIKHRASESSEVLSRPGSPRPSSPAVSQRSEEDVNLEYLRNVILQFLEHKEMRPNLVRVLSTILRFTPQETRRLIAKV